ncbi:helix-turn-helix domain-containing protein [Leptolyngbya sp. FACHB-671]|uniref:helix-turn-helix domain-containing protein n=1 Tax=Leptolyngbya sp. FACHB-671 TaxID=2692812 RepID=UPI0016896DF3|nr:helix-turn-helix domain-containing protein [Leptolyngbya sp. FACHB-671]MBD2066195.1 helix-turn-helix domain-containing protein [Leptolyngbya sp. FACHB-671]
MGKPVQVLITETAEFLSELLEQEKDLMRYQKLRTLYLLKTESLRACGHIAELIGRHEGTVRRWVRKYRQVGLQKLLEDEGRDLFVGIPSEICDRLVERYQDTQFLPPIKNIQEWVLQEFGVSIPQGKLQRLLRFKVLSMQRLHHADQGGKAGAGEIEASALKAVYKQFSEWSAERGFPNETQALNQLMGEIFQVRPVQFVSPLQQPGKTLIESISQAPLTTEIPYNIPELLNQNRLAARLKVDPHMLIRNRTKRTFPGWAKLKDPDKVGWLWVPHLQKYRPLLSNEEIQAILLSPNRSEPS